MEEFITKEQFDNFNSEGFTHGSLNRLVEIIIMRALEEFLKTLPGVVSNLISSAAVMKTIADNFYKDNSDLSEHRLIVAKAIEEIERSNPGMKIEELLKKAGPIARERIDETKKVNSGNEKVNIEEIDRSLGVL